MAQALSGLTAGTVNDLLTGLVYVAMVALFVIWAIKCALPVFTVRRVLRRAIRDIKQGENAKRSWQAEAFLGKGPLYPHWSEYLNNLFFADGEFHNPSNVEDFINEDTAVYGPGRAQLSEAVPGLMVSLGFLGTLIGISAGLQGFGMDDADQVMRAIRQLVPGMQYAFTTSIVGVLFSLGITIVTKLSYGGATRALADFYNAMSKHAGVLSVDPMTQIAIYQQEQTALIQGMAKDLSGAMTERMAESMSLAINKSMAALKGSFDDFTHKVSVEQLRGVDMMVQRFLQQMNQSVDGQFDRLRQTLEDTNRNQHEMSENVRKSLDGVVRVSQNVIAVSQLSDDMLRKYDEYVGKLTASSKQAEEGYARIAASVEHLEIVARQQNSYLQSLAKLQDAANAALADFEAAGEQLADRIARNMEEAGQALASSSESIQQSGAVLAANHKALVGGVSKDIDRAYNTFFKTTNETVDHINWVMEDVRNAVSALPGNITTAAELYARQADRLTDALRRSQEAMDDAVDRLTQVLYGGGGQGR